MNQLAGGVYYAAKTDRQSGEIAGRENIGASKQNTAATKEKHMKIRKRTLSCIV
jgi:hypothetical protein